MAQNIEYIAIFLAVVFLAVVVVFLISQQKVLQLVEPRFRQIRPGQVWLQVIPIFGVVWQFIVVSKISYAIQSQLLAQSEDTILGSSIDPSHRPTYRTGINYCILITIGMFLGFLPPFGIQSVVLNFVQSIINLAGVIIWIVYWIDLEKYKRMLKLRVAGGAVGS